MKISKIRVNSQGYGMEDALDEVEGFSHLMGFDERSARRVRLLAEETMSMVRATVEDFAADFWMESTPKWNCELHLHMVKPLDYAVKRGLINVSSRQRNGASVGIMGKIKDFIEGSLQLMKVGAAPDVADRSILCMGGVAPLAGSYMWSLDKYRQDVKSGDGDVDMEAALDELEKSIVANIADDVRVYVKGDSIELVIRKNF
ncbi:MAG: hypothetical protein K6F95_09380 [Selenomonas sp.]|uniref:hypothetical protein n=1 Tax=Selenomonas sp. TaxID=2053611 RepID=UPI0025FB496B|nr:hypothetical protein [Selenomonas sp.]MCR5758104.1 hypothetical protein [Selenomonas sp.]